MLREHRQAAVCLMCFCAFLIFVCQYIVYYEILIVEYYDFEEMRGTIWFMFFISNVT